MLIVCITTSIKQMRLHYTVLNGIKQELEILSNFTVLIRRLMMLAFLSGGIVILLGLKKKKAMKI